MRRRLPLRCGFSGKTATPGILRHGLDRDTTANRRERAARPFARSSETTVPVEEHEHAREEDHGARPRGRQRGQVTLHPGGRVRPRGGPSHKRGKARRPLDEAGDRDRPLEGATRRGQAPTSQEGTDLGEDAPECRARLPQGTERFEPHLAATLEGDRERAPPRGHSAASSSSLSRQARSAAQKRSAADRSRAARKAVETKGPRARSVAAKKAARTRAKNR